MTSPNTVHADPFSAFYAVDEDKEDWIVSFAVSGVYGLFQGLDLMYVGMSSNLSSRLKTHRRARGTSFVMKCLRCEEGLARVIEKHLIRAYQPPWNKALHGPKDYNVSSESRSARFEQLPVAVTRYPQESTNQKSTSGQSESCSALPGFFALSTLWAGQFPLFPSEQSARWFVRQQRAALVQAKAIAIWRGRTWIHLENLDDVILQTSTPKAMTVTSTSTEVSA